MRSITPVIFAATLLCHPAMAQDPVPSAANPQAQGEANKQAMQAEMEKQFFVSMVALKNVCKQRDADHAKNYDASWDKNTADAPDPLKALAKTPDFEARVAARVAELTAAKAENEADVKAACDKMLASQ